MTTYKNTRTNTLAELLDRREDGATMRLIETGEEIQVGIPTLKRWWRPVENTPIKDGSDTKSVSDPEQGIPLESQDNPDESESTQADTSKPESKSTPVEPMRLSEIVRKLEDLFDTLNDLYYEGKLPRPVITVQSTPKFYGHCSTKQIWKSEDEAMYEINIGAEFLNRPKEDIAATMQHEIIHLFCRVNDIDETCQKGRYHNKTFKIEAETRGLIIGYNRTIGHSLTEPSDDFKEKLQEAGFDLGLPFSREVFTAKKTANREKPHKYMCPVCGQTVRSTADLNIICGECDVPLERRN